MGDLLITILLGLVAICVILLAVSYIMNMLSINANLKNLIWLLVAVFVFIAIVNLFQGHGLKFT